MLTLLAEMNSEVIIEENGEQNQVAGTQCHKLNLMVLTTTDVVNNLELTAGIVLFCSFVTVFSLII